MQSLKKPLMIAVATLCLLALYLLMWPVPVDPVAWVSPPSPELSGPYALNQALAEVTRFDLPDGHGPEDVDVDAQGWVYGGLQDGRIMRHRDGVWETFADTGGRPLGLDFDVMGNLIVADAFKGLLSINPNGDITVLTTQAEGTPFLFTDDVDIAADGVIYFSDASYKFNQHQYKLDALEHRPNGRLLAYHPQSGETRVLLKDLHFANGIALSSNDAFVLVNETWTYSIRRYWLKGDKAGQADVFIQHLPGFPDGISCDENGTFWLALASPRNPLIDILSEKPFLRRVVARLPAAVQPKPTRHAMVLGLDEDAGVVANLQAYDQPRFAVITSVEAHQGYLYLGSLEEPAYARIKRPER